MKKQRQTNNHNDNNGKDHSSSKEVRGKAANIDKAMRGVDRPHVLVVKEQPPKDNSSKRVNFDNAKRSKVFRAVERGMNSSDGNDISWYTRNPELLRAAASIPFGSILGFNYSTTNQQIIPGICVLNWQPAFGSNIDVINQCWNSKYSFVVHANSRNYKYDAPDLGLLCCAGMDIFNIIGTMMWAFGTFRYFQAERNLYYPKQLLKARGFSFDDMMRSSSKAWFDINNLISQTRQIWFPNDMPIFERWFWMNTSYFTDAPGTTSQTYLYNQDTFYIYDETDFQEGGAMVAIDESGQPWGKTPTSTKFNPGPDHIYDWDKWVSIAQAMINAVIDTQDRGIIFGDLLNAYGADRIQALSPIESNYLIAPTFNAEVLSQFENANTTNALIHGFGQADNDIVTVWSDSVVPLIGWSDDPTLIDAASGSMIMNFHFPEQPTPEQVVIATRAKSFGLYTNQAAWKFNFTNNQLTHGRAFEATSFASELYHSMAYCKFVKTGGTSREDKWFPIPSITYFADKDISTITEMLGDMMAFDWHPFINVYASTSAKRPTTNDSTPTGNSPDFSYGDYDNYAELSELNLSKIHSMAMFSLLGVPTLMG